MPSRNVRVLLDEHLPRRLVRELLGHQVSTVQAEGWAGIKNSPLLALATKFGFEVFLTSDRGLEFQQNLADVGIGIIVLRASSNAIEDIRPLLPSALEAIDNVRPGEVRSFAV